jgi:curli biogenesis system outer membrane secretion channel CsgG
MMQAFSWSLVLRTCVLAGSIVGAGCAVTAKVTDGADGATISEAQAEKYNGPKARIAVGPIIDKTGSRGKRSLSYNLRLLKRKKGAFKKLDANNITSSIRDMLTTSLFNSNRYIVLERDTIKDVLVEQEFSASGRVGEATKIPMGQIEGAELLVVGALTGFDPGAAGGGGFPIPIPVGDDDFAILRLNFRSSYIAMDVRVLDVKTSRVLAAVSAQGKVRKVKANVGALVSTSWGHINLPVVLSGFTNTPMEKAINKMVRAAVQSIVDKTPAQYRRYQ